MSEFLQTALTFPTVVFSVLLSVSVVYWLLAATDLVDADAPDALLGGDGEVSDASGAAAMLARLRLSDVPVMVVVTALSFTAWFGTYFVHLLVLRHLPDGLRVLAGAGVLLAVLVPSAAVTSLLLRPVGRWLSRLRAPAEPSLLGRVGTIVTPTLAPDYGQAAVDDGGAGLILQVRHDEPGQLKRGDRIVLIEYLEGQHAYRVISEKQFLGR
ncbi:MAG TPA: hypothetical protein VGR37_05050 [Longimicrobiaceae bacterium]|nr:hypothetical protein [Longimicrobiaceae bacterium]